MLASDTGEGAMWVCRGQGNKRIGLLQRSRRGGKVTLEVYRKASMGNRRLIGHEIEALEQVNR